MLHLAYYDRMTDLPNRLLFEKRLRQSLGRSRRRGRCLALLLVDLDRFKEVNDTFGHAGGDLILRSVGQCLRKGLREGDVIGRLSGDEFVVLLTGADSRREVVELVHELHHLFASPFLLDEKEVFLGASVGISVFPLWRKGSRPGPRWTFSSGRSVSKCRDTTSVDRCRRRIWPIS
ncbi:MAG TPA: GGDEF domain-containing protein [Desulfuromonadales bacterium]|nr:GGDEF domain-containing protein [Desulfuromonadales bacterium]